MSNTWSDYYQLTKNKPPSKLLLEAIEHVNQRKSVLDLGSGSLKDSRYLIEAGFEKVVAVDKEQPPSEILEQIPQANFEFIQSSFIDYEFPEQAFDLVNAQYSLPFNNKSDFPVVWKRIVSCLKPQGIFTGQLFGLHDEWNVPETEMTFYSREQAEKLLTDLDLLSFVEEEKDGTLANGQKKHWHIFHIIAQKK